MKFSGKIPYKILFALFIGLFFISKLPALHMGYFWDELGVYVPGMREIAAKKTLGLLPADLDPLYSRGHPLLFYFLGATAFKIFGDSVLVGHLLAILIACGVLIVFYKMCNDLFTPDIALGATILTAVQPLFFSMSGILLPEMLLTLFTIMVIWGILAKKWVLYAVGASLAILTKEAAIILPPLALLILFIDSIRGKDFFTLKRWGLFCVAVIPLVVYGLFLLIQKFQNGWYFFPEHVGLVHINPVSLYTDGGRIVYELLAGQGRWFLLILLLGGLVFSNKFFRSPVHKRLLMVVGIFFLVSSFFSAINYFLSRYHLYAYPFFILLCILAIKSLGLQIKGISQKVFYILVFTVASSLAVYHMDGKKFSDTYDMSYTTTVKSVQHVITWLQSQPYFDSTFSANFPIEQALENPGNGYINKPKGLAHGNDKATYFLGFYLDGQELYNPGNFDSLIQKFDIEYVHLRVMTFKQ